jgi:hypothetical protein
MATTSIVEDFDAFEYRADGLRARSEVDMENEGVLKRGEEASATALSQQFPRRLMLAIMP